MAPPGNATAPPPLAQFTLRQTAFDYPAINPANFKDGFSGRVALITGSSRGIGKAMAKAFAEAGYSIAITARNASEVEGSVRELEESYAKIKVVGVPADGCKRSDLERLVSKAWPR
ncbi:hypothetical protein LTR56_012909 [Elasticomyces elasticus]|nr:hypothetical protein LTR56_012909 [Elasticomyces elasticus]KAK3650835.1 hypothetical protein LTR22_012434 [Elasticomyces elasticus]KAK4918539.1 hypothetical protein LTR49_013772 [Elasticomyces elasticus]KAK5757823.1 hypothetical protein LTS12_012007 [Elasticomyces elasticus]